MTNLFADSYLRAFVGLSVAVISSTIAFGNPVPGSASTEDGNLPEDSQIELNLKIVELDESVFNENRERIEIAAGSISDAAFEQFTEFLQGLKGADVLRMPRVSTSSGKSATIVIIREFRFPTEYHDSGTPTQFDTKNLGFTFTATPKRAGDTISLNGTLQISEFLGFISDSKHSPAFQDREVRVFREFKKGTAAVVVVPSPGEGFALREPYFKQVQKHEKSSKRLLLLLQAGQWKRMRVLKKDEGEQFLQDLLEKTRLEGMGSAPMPVTEVVQALTHSLLAATDYRTEIHWHSAILGEVPEVTLDTEGKTAKQVLDTLTKQTDLGYHLEGSTLVLGSRKELAMRKRVGPGNIPYANAVPGKSGYVVSPHAPNAGYVDVRRYQQGAKVQCPYTKMMFLVP